MGILYGGSRRGYPTSVEGATPHFPSRTYRHQSGPRARVKWDLRPKPLTWLTQPSPHTPPARDPSEIPLTTRPQSSPIAQFQESDITGLVVRVNIFLQRIFPSILRVFDFLAGVAVTMENQVATGHTVKRRSARACSSCRSRKVRCNVVECGPPCTNCRLDSVKCVTVRNRRHRSVCPRPD